MLPRVLFLVGGPGVGKGLLCSNLTKKYPKLCCHLSAGDLLRAEKAKPDSESAKIINDCISNGKIVPVEITVKLLHEAMHKLGSERLFLIDGYPRNEDNVQGWNKVIGDKCNLLGCLSFICPKEIMIERVMKRANESDVIRSDDNLATVEKRIAGHYENTVPALAAYQDKLYEIDATKTPEEVQDQVETVLRKLEVIE